MTSTINASTVAGIVTTADTSGELALQSNGTTALSTSGANVTIAGTLTTAAQSIAKASLPTGSVLQVVSTAKTDTFSLAATTTFTDITGLSVSITPTSATSKIYVVVSVGGASMSAGGSQAYRLVRGSTAIGVGAAAGTRQPTSFRDFNGSTDGNAAFGGYTFSFLDSPATVSATTYKLQLIVQTGTGYINRSTTDSDTDNVWGTRSASTITVMEISA
jgi:hypothetical protein